MPTENERKYILLNEPSVIHSIAKKAQKILAIEQAWLHNGKGWNLRIRKTFGPHFSEPKFYLTYKQNTDKRLIEIETEIEERDYYDLLKLSSNTTLQKTRYVIPVGVLKWEIDLFYDKKRTIPYFVMAEVELPEGTKTPKIIPNFVLDNLVLEVPIGNNQYSSRKLQDIEYAIKHHISPL